MRGPTEMPNYTRKTSKQMFHSHNRRKTQRRKLAGEKLTFLHWASLSLSIHFREFWKVWSDEMRSQTLLWERRSLPITIWFFFLNTVLMFKKLHWSVFQYRVAIKSLDNTVGAKVDFYTVFRYDKTILGANNTMWSQQEIFCETFNASWDISRED